MSDRKFHYCKDGETVEGPFTLRQLEILLSEGGLDRQGLICEVGAEDWIPLADVVVVTQKAAPPLPAQPSPPSAEIQKLEASFQQQILMQGRKRSPAAALLLNFFIPGAGYAYGGMIVMGVFVFVLWAVLVILAFLTFGFTGLIAALIWIVGIIDGPLAVGRHNRRLAKNAVAGRLR